MALVFQSLILFSIMSVTFSYDSDSDSPPAPLTRDYNGYIVYCPCMGRFGNQADQFLGSLAFAKAANRTLILPPWVEYRKTHRFAIMVAFDTYFQVAPLLEYHRVVTMERFMADLANEVWPAGKRQAFCYSERGSKNTVDKCNAKEGNPFRSFWDWFEINFDKSVLYGPLYYEASNPRVMTQWMSKYPSGEYPVWAFVGPPAEFPVASENVKLHKYVQWSEVYQRDVKDFIRKSMRDQPFIGIHLRNGPDFEKACEHVSSTPNMFAAKQCTGERSQYGTTTHEMCFPSADTVAKQVKEEVDRLGVKCVFIATDYNDLKVELTKVLGNKVKLVQQEEPVSAMLDLAILGQSDHFIGNCVSTFTAFVKRERDANSKQSSFWAFKRRGREDL